jgi:hypothetical protein
MKPKLSDEVIARQIAKLDEAVRIVEREHAEALPDTDNAPPVQANLAAEDPQPVETADPYGGPASRVEYDSRSEQIADLAPSTDADAYQVAVERFGDNPSQRPDRLPEDRLLDNPEAFFETKRPVMPEASMDIPWNSEPFDHDREAAIDTLVQEENQLNIEVNQDGTISAKTENQSLNSPDVMSDVDVIASKLKGKSFRAQPKAPIISRNMFLAGVLGLIIIGVSSYGLWQVRDSVTAVFSGLMSTETATKTETPAAGSSQPETTPATQSQAAATDPAKSEPPAKSEKFTQRLMADGSETSESLNSSPLPVGKEGTSVAAKTDNGANAPATSAQEPAPDTAETAPAAQSPDAAASGQKMFLYEERLGQASPTAIAGSVTWSVANDTTVTDGKPQSEIQAKITVPDRGLSALITFKRNTDKSLPASHVVELVFSLPKDFDGGNVESVQRIAMKATEEDRGNALIAVPAKITDDFHMIALNDDPAAISSNTDLLKTRGWIDIPITYRNGRRALITLEKGPAGTADFNTVMAEWAALNPT